MHPLASPPRRPHPRAAYADGWRAHGAGTPVHDRPHYPTFEEREAFTKGWNDAKYLEAMGYTNLYGQRSEPKTCLKAHEADNGGFRDQCISFAAADLSEEKANAISAARMDERHAHLDAMLDE